MKYYKLFLYCFLLITPLFGFTQKQIIVETDTNYKYVNEDIPKYNLKDLIKAKDSLSIRVWIGGRNISLELTKNEKISGSLILNCLSAKKQPEKKVISLNEITAKKLLDSLLVLKIKDLPHNAKRSALDGSLYIFEISEPTKYRRYSYWSPRLGTDTNINKAYQIIKTIDNELQVFEKFEKFLQDLPSGNYIVGMSSVMVDRFLDERVPKSSGYTFVEQMMRKEMVIDNSLRFPKIIINGKQDVFMKDLNKYKKSQIKDVKIFKRGPEAAALYGSFGGKHGVVLITLNDKN